MSQKAIANHEAAHAVVAVRLGLPLASTSIKPQSFSDGEMSPVPESGRVASALLEREELTGDEVRSLVGAEDRGNNQEGANELD